MCAQVKVAAAHSPVWNGIDFRLSRDEALKAIEGNVREILALVDAAADAGCIAVAFPEDTLGMTGLEAYHFDDQKPVVDPAVRMLFEAVGGKAAERSIYVIVCTDVFYDNDCCNTAVLFGRDGSQIGRYHKVNLPIGEQTRKRGDAFPVFQTEELGGVGMCICYDMVFPETTRALALGGADVVFHLTMGGAACPGGTASDAAFITRAADNELYLVVSWRGNSRIISPAGEVLAQGDTGGGLTVAEFDPFSGREFGDATGGTFPDHRARLFRERVPQAYAILTEPNPPVLAKFKDTPLPEVQDVARLAAEVLTTGEERFSAAGQLVNEGKTEEAIREYEAMSERFGTTWIGRAARKRLVELRDRSG
jgi:predicted amidohydrolase